MLSIAIMLFVFAAVFGAIVLLAILSNKPTPKPVVIIHGTLAGIGLLLAVTYVAIGKASTLQITGLVLLLLAALGGFTLFGIDISNKKIPKALAIGHPFLAIIGVILLIVSFFVDHVA